MFASWVIGSTRDISGGGMRIVAQKSSIPIMGEFLDVEIRLNEGIIISAISCVTRVTSQQSTLGEFGVQFVQIHPSDRRCIVQHAMKVQAAMRDSMMSNRKSF